MQCVICGGDNQFTMYSVWSIKQPVRSKLIHNKEIKPFYVLKVVEVEDRIYSKFI